MKSFPLLWMAFLIYSTFGFTAKSAIPKARDTQRFAKFIHSFANLCVYNDLLNWILDITRGFNHGDMDCDHDCDPVVKTTGYV
jgi:hypothetical protein